MKVHYFQRYHQKENVATANTMLLLNRLYSYSPRLFFNVLQSEETFGEVFDPEVSFNLQEAGPHSVADATISQNSFKIAARTTFALNVAEGTYCDKVERRYRDHGHLGRGLSK